MSPLSKKLSSVFLCGTMAVTLVGSSGVHAADEVAAALGNESENASSNERDEKVESSGSGLSGGVAKGLGTAALVLAGVGADEGVRLFRGRRTSESEVSGEATVVEVGTKIEDLERLNEELLKKLEKLEEAEKNPTVFGNLLWGASTGFFGFIPALRDKLVDVLGKNIDNKSKESIIAFVIAEVIGLVLAIWSIARIIREKPDGWKQWTYSVARTLTDVLLPPAGLIWKCAEMLEYRKVLAYLNALEFAQLQTLIEMLDAVDSDSVENLKPFKKNNFEDSES